MKNFWSTTGVVLGTTIGAGVFALPHIISSSGLLVGAAYLLVIGFGISFAHVVYIDVLEKSGNEKGADLLGLARTHFGKWGFGIGLAAILTGLMLAMVVYLILAVDFIDLIWPTNPAVALIVFWAAASLPLLIKERRFLTMETIGALTMALIIAGIFILPPDFAERSVGLWTGKNIFLPFGPVLFSLAAWTAIEPVFRLSRKSSARGVKAGLFAGTMLAVLLYVFFVLGIFSSAAEIAPNTLDGLKNWPQAHLATLGLLGLFALWTSYVPAALEVKNSLTQDLGWRKKTAWLTVIFLPLLLVALGLNDFLLAVSVAGGVFVSLQYLMILALGRRVLKPRGFTLFAIYVLTFAFAIAAAYELYIVLK